MSATLDRALRRAAEWHRAQTRKGTDTPYVEHLFGVALILDRLGFDEDVLIAGLLHDAVEDAAVPAEQIARHFGGRVAGLVAHCTEDKHDASGCVRPWDVRKAEYREALRAAPLEARAIALADKLHNLVSILADLEDGADVWTRFSADRAECLRSYRQAIDELGADPRLDPLARECRRVLDRIAGWAGPASPEKSAGGPVAG